MRAPEQALEEICVGFDYRPTFQDRGVGWCGGGGRGVAVCVVGVGVGRVGWGDVGLCASGADVPRLIPGCF